MTQSVNNVAQWVQELYALVAKFEQAFPGRKFTPDGHLVGSIGEVIAAHRYDMTLYPASSKTHDGIANHDGRQVEIKITQGKQVALRSQPAHLIVLRLDRDGEVSEVFNGPGSFAWEIRGKKQKNGQCPIFTSKLKKLMKDLDGKDKLPIRDLND
jgi:hypothetical protein